MRQLVLAAALFLIPLLTAPVEASTQEPVSFQCGTGIHAAEAQGRVWFPEGDLFCPLLADPKAERSFFSFLQGEFATLTDATDETNLASLGLGDRFVVLRQGGGTPGEGWQLGVTGAIFAQFDFDTESIDLINADYIAGVPLSWRFSGHTARLTVFHQSSHLGDEYVLRSDLERQNLSFEGIDLVVSQEAGPGRLYAGGQYLFRRDPETLEDLVAHAGAELRIGDIRGVRLVGAVDVKASEEQDWEPGVSARAGIEAAVWNQEDHPPRLFDVVAEYYSGPSPYGQFFQEQISYLGVGVHFSLR
jgi:hypothetical protein